MVNQFKDSKIKAVAEFTIKVYSDMLPEELEEALISFAPTDGKILFNNRMKQMNVLDVSEVYLLNVKKINEEK